MAEFTEEQIKEVVESLEDLVLSERRYQRYEESFDFHADAGDNTVNGSPVKPDRILVVTNMWAYDENNAPTYIRLGYWNRTRYVWFHIVAAPAALVTVEFHGVLHLQEGMWPAIQGNGLTADDDIFGGALGYWVRAPRIS